MSLVVLRIVALAALVFPLPARAGTLPLESSTPRATMIEQISPSTSPTSAASIDQAGLLTTRALAGVLVTPLNLPAPDQNGNVALVEVQGLGNDVSVIQSGLFDTAIIMQKGTGNHASVTQSSNGNYANVTQIGNNNLAIIRQGH